MRRVCTVLALVLLVFGGASTAAASDHPSRGCPPPFHLHQATDHDDHHGPHRHVGTDADHNGDGWICVKHVGVDDATHVHIDNDVPFR